MVKMVNVMVCVFCLNLETTYWSKYHQVNVRDGYDDLGDRPPSLLVNPALPMGSCAQVGAGVTSHPPWLCPPCGSRALCGHVLIPEKALFSFCTAAFLPAGSWTCVDPSALCTSPPVFSVQTSVVH